MPFKKKIYIYIFSVKQILLTLLCVIQELLFGLRHLFQSASEVQHYWSPASFKFDLCSMLFAKMTHRAPR